MPPETVQNTFDHNDKNQFNFWRTTTNNQEISGNSAKDTNNKFKKWIARDNKKQKQTSDKWPNNIFGKLTNEAE